MNTKLFPIFFAPEGGESTPAVSAVDSPTGQDIAVTPRSEPPAPEIIAAEPKAQKQIRQAGVKTSKVDVAKELGLTEAPSEANEKEAKRVRDEQGKFVKKGTDPFEKKEEPKPEVKLGEPTPKPEKKVESAPSAKTEPPAPVKIKIGDQEKTAEEWAAYHRELAEKAEAAAKKAETEAPKADEPKPEEVQAAQKKQRDEWFEKATARYTPDAKEFDKMIAEGDAKAFGKYFANVEENIRAWVLDLALKPIAERLSSFDGTLNPILEREKLVEAYQREGDFLNAHPDIKAHAEAVHTMRELAGELHTEREDIQALLAATPNSPNAPRYQSRLDELSGEKFLNTLAEELRQKLGTAKPAPVAATTAPAPAATPAKPRPPAPSGQLSSVPSPTKKSNASSEIADLMSHGF